MTNQQKNLCWLTAGKVLELAISFCVGLAVARHIGAYQLGVMAVCFLIVGIAQRAAQSGLWAPISRRAKDPDNHVWEHACRTILLKRSWIWFLAILCICVLPIPHRMELILAALVLPGNTSEIRAWAQTARFQSKSTLVADRTAQAVTGIFQISMIYFNGNPMLMTLAMPIMGWTRAIILLWEDSKKTGDTKTQIETILKETKGTRFSVVAQFLNQNIPVFVAGIINPAAAGLIYAASRVQQLTGLPAQLIQYNEAAQVVNHGKWKLTLVKINSLAFAAGVVTIAGAEPIIKILYGPGFEGAITPLKWMMTALPSAISITILEVALLHHKLDESCKTSLQKPAVIGIITGGMAAAIYLTTQSEGNQTTTLATATGIFMATQSWTQASMLFKSLILLKLKGKESQCPTQNNHQHPRAKFLIP